MPQQGRDFDCPKQLPGAIRPIITDHAGAQAFPDAYAAGRSCGIRFSMGFEANDGEPVPIIRKPMT